MMAEYTKLQKVLLLKAALCAFYLTAFFGDRIGMPSFSEKFFGQKNNAMRKSASDWAGLGLFVMTLDLLYAALKCSKAVQQRVCNGQIMHNMLMLAVHACFSSQKFGGKLVHKEHVMGGFLTLALTFVMSAGLAGGMEPAKRHFLKGCKGLTHGCLIIYWACFFFYITTFQLGDFPSQNYIACQGRGFCRAKDSVFYDINVFTSSMWFMVNMMTYFMLMSGSDNEQKSFALYRMATVALLQIPLMMSEKAMTVPKEYTNGVVAMSICLTALACAAFSDKIKPKKA
jgi:hypothetical protein